ncbi:MAG: hypothetical protein N2561_06345 [Bacteroidetes bacterium]|nr:hypothetical protein [Rhodothermia bacterium]MCS7154703.1 hypothetical protein [Bacteroidota bacterium]MCX7907140.1 hypothetical protein [Bacteroidota bacterium]MDW8137496.1 hypothetical protein [Bacteroidota bacterium]MDW8285550.1 hypothetical protein [Bacteroidota bacterium]
MSSRDIPQAFGEEGYLYVTYGDLRYLRHAVASVVTLRRYDTSRPVALVCSEAHREALRARALEGLFDLLLPLAPEHASVVGFKHNFYRYLPFQRTLYVDADLIWCRAPDPLWQHLRAYSFTITGTQVADIFFGGPKDVRVLWDWLLNRRQRTLNRFGLTYLSRVQAGMMFTQDRDLARRVGDLAAYFLRQMPQTHFRSRRQEVGRSEESAEWSLAMAMAKLNLPVFPWLQGQESPQLDFVADFTEYDPDFERVSVLYYCRPLLYALRSYRPAWLRTLLMGLLSLLPGWGDYLYVTPYALHFGILPEKGPFDAFADRLWAELTLTAAPLNGTSEEPALSAQVL